MCKEDTTSTLANSICLRRHNCLLSATTKTPETNETFELTVTYERASDIEKLREKVEVVRLTGVDGVARTHEAYCSKRGSGS